MSTTKEKDKERVVNTFCAFHCAHDACAFQASVKEDKIVHLERHPKLKYASCKFLWTFAQRVYHPDRLRYPMKRIGNRGEGQWERITWDEALDTIAERLNDVKAKYGNEALLAYNYGPHLALPSGFFGVRSTIHRLFNLWGGCIPSFERGSLCYQATLSANNYLFGNIKSVLPPDIGCELIILWSNNPAVNSQRAPINSLLDAKEKGTRFIVIDPVFTDTAALLADEFVAPLPGTDVAIALAMLNILIGEGLYDKEFLLKYTNAPFLVRDDTGEILKEREIKGEKISAEDESVIYEGTFRRIVRSKKDDLVWDSNSQRPCLQDEPGISPALTGRYAVDGISCRTVWERLIGHVKEWTPERAAQLSQVPAATIEKIARELGKAKPAKVLASLSGGFQRTTWGENAVYSLGLLNAILGSIRGYFVCDNERLPSVDLGLYHTTKKWEVDNPVKKRVPISCDAEAILNPEAYGTNIRALFVMNGNPVGQHPNSNKTIQALLSDKLEFIAVTDIFMSETAKYADILLPASTTLERAMIYESCDTSSFYYPQLLHLPSKKHIVYADRVVEPLWESKDDFEIICELARKMGYGEYFPWKQAEEWIEDLLNMAKEDQRFPWLKEISMDQLKKEGIVEVDAPPQKINWDIKTPSGKIELYNETLLKMGYDPMPVYRDLAEGPVTTPELYRKYPLYFICWHYKLTMNSSFVNQPEILELGENNVLINPVDAERRGINDGDMVVVFNDRGKIEIRARVSEEIRAGVVCIGHTGWMKYGNTSVLTSDRLTSGYGESPTHNTGLVEVKKG